MRSDALTHNKADIREVTLEDKYIAEDGRAFMTGTQSLVRLPLTQMRRDRAAGLNTGAFISGYRGSPIGGYDQELWRARDHLKAHDVVFQPGVNEELAATAVWGSQQLHLSPGARKDGVMGIWYGKGPGVDRCGDVFKHANAAGTSRHGGVLCLAGDDHACKSSTLPHQSDHAFMSALMPMLYPSSIHEFLELGLLGIAMSRFSGVWVGMKLISDTVETSAAVDLKGEQRQFMLPNDFEMPAEGLNLRWPDAPTVQDERLQNLKGYAAIAYARANGVDLTTIDSPNARFGIMASGKGYEDVVQALKELEIGEAEAREIGLRLYKVRMPWPLEPEGVRHFSEGLEEVLVVEERREIIENQIKQQLFNWRADVRPRIIGKFDEAEKHFLSLNETLTVGAVARAVASRILRFDIDQGLRARIEQKLAYLEGRGKIGREHEAPVVRTPYFCSGCPHNTSTRVPDGSRALAGIGCHFMAVWMDRNTETFTQMGGEGVPWTGLTSFTDEKHIFANLGDGTYFHSGFLAIRQSVASKANITYKILYNDAVAMTGGQPHDGTLTVWDISLQVHAEGAKRVVVVTDEPDKYPSGLNWAPGLTIHHRDDLDKVQKELRATPGLTVLIYDQTCAAEKRRRRKRGTFPDPAKRVFINEEVCEGCGDCSVQSNCVSVKPLDTDLGRKRRIDQSDCNKDFSCLKGFCPSFVTIEGGGVRKGRKPSLKVVGADADPFADLPLPTVPELTEPYGILITGIGGTGVITVGALIGMAAHLEGKGATALDFTGLAQKNGAVMSHVRLAPKPEDLYAVRIAAGGSNLVLGCDMVVAASQNAISTMEQGVTRAVLNSALQPTAAFVTDNDMDLGEKETVDRLVDALGDDHADFISATSLATAIMGDSIAANLFLLGFAWQKGLIPLSFDALDQAIAINNVAIAMNRQSFAWGRLAAHDMAAVEKAAAPRMAAPARREPTLEETIADRVTRLTAYQNAAYADRYRQFVDKAIQAEKSKVRGHEGLGMAVARSLYKLMAYKDEYEVARLYADPAYMAQVRDEFGPEAKVHFYLAAPLVAKHDHKGRPIKKKFGRWMLQVFRVLQHGRRLRGSAWDLFGRTDERRLERKLRDDYLARITALLPKLSADNLDLAVEIASLPDGIRGYGHVKDAAVEIAEAKLAELMKKWPA